MLPTLLRAMALLVSMIGFAAASYAATFTYTYTGNQFDDISDNPSMPGSYSSGMSISGFVTLNMPLAANRNASTNDADDLLPIAVDFSFTDGRQTFDISDFGPTGPAAISIGTDAMGNITDWIIQFDRRSLAASLGDIAGVLSTSSVFDRGTIGICVSAPTCVNFPSDSGQVRGAPGTWTVSNDMAAIPLPGALLSLISAFGFAGLIRNASRRSL